MVASTFKEAFSEEWVKEHIKDSLNELVIFRRVIPWQSIIGTCRNDEIRCMLRVSDSFFRQPLRKLPCEL